MSATRRPRGSAAVFGALVAVLVASGLLGGLGRVTTAQEATPQAAAQATPLPSGGVPCTFLFGIQDPSAACVLVINASPDAPFLDLYLDGSLAVPGVEFGILGDFVEVPSGEHQVQLTVAGTDPADAVIEETVRFAPGVAYEVAAIGPRSETELLTRAVNTTPLPADTARVAVVHASPDAPAIDLAVAGGDVLAADLAFLDLVEGIEVPAGVYPLTVRPAGEDTVLVSLGEAALDANVTYTYYIIGQVADNTIGGFVVPVAVPPAAVEAVEATPVP